MERFGKLLDCQGQILFRCYLLRRSGPCRLWGLGPASRNSMVLGPAGTKAGRSVAPGARLPPGSISRMCSASYLPGAATCERCDRVSLVINMRRGERVGAEFKIMTV